MAKHIHEEQSMSSILSTVSTEMAVSGLSGETLKLVSSQSPRPLDSDYVT